jgi:hypothetical protein
MDPSLDFDLEDKGLIAASTIMKDSTGNVIKTGACYRVKFRGLATPTKCHAFVMRDPTTYVKFDNMIGAQNNMWTGEDVAQEPSIEYIEEIPCTEASNSSGEPGGGGGRRNRNHSRRIRRKKTKRRY